MWLFTSWNGMVAEVAPPAMAKSGGGGGGGANRASSRGSSNETRSTVKKASYFGSPVVWRIAKGTRTPATSL
jgi:hypothetical protein